MGMMTQMMSATGMDAEQMELMEACIEACAACEQACVMCSDADLGDGMMRCSSMCSTCADVCNAMMRMMMRPTGWDMDAMTAMLRATIAMCTACAAECGMHADMHEHCAMCAQACRDCIAACENLLAAMPAMAGSTAASM
jgi:hypothetical protein